MAPRDVLAGLDPPALWAHFSNITAIPRRSGQEAAIAEYIAHWAVSYGFPSRRDAPGNICVYVPPSKESPGPRTVALQAHLDMVCIRAEKAASDPAAGSIEIVREGQWLVAPNSTLGADNGIGIAAAMSIAESEDAPHGPLELLFTVEEETTGKGADGLDPSLIQAKVMVNLDAETSGVLDIGSAGSKWVGLRWPAPPESIPRSWLVVDIALSGLCGGHSGLEIGRNRLNGIKGIVWTIRRIPRDITFRLCAIEGGDACNAIPMRAHATIAFPPAERPNLEKHLAAAGSALKTRFAQTDPGLSLSMESIASQEAKCWSEESCARLLDLLAVVPSGVIAMEQVAPDIVETSNNLGIVALKVEGLEIDCLSRSSVAAALEEAITSIESAARLAGADFTHSSRGLPPWRVASDSAALATVQAAYRDLFSRDPRLVTVHAGVESGLIQQRIPGLQIVSLGPDIQGAHTVGERVNIASVVDFYNLLTEVVQRLAR